ncbi:DNA-binding protein [Pedobacter frigidisoli]|uniref:DNA-binding protein n=1 Tax=Pedobacter frigidisoli TaxID=2530455 RepID=A0A4R0NW22_9SPHI|nr:helix-turn-helix domain-containing protein [Pedobacter frigidisoli]TCD05880.1 DNA-binding protein [Pedobacter frigidisoli]
MKTTFDDLPRAVEKINEKLDKMYQLLLAKENLKDESAEQFLNINQAATMLTLSVNTIYSKVHNRQIPYYKQGKRLYFSRSDLTKWIISIRHLQQRKFKIVVKIY